MGDKRRFDVFARYIRCNFKTDCRVADVAGGKGQLQQALRERGFNQVMTFDKRKGRRDRPRMRYQYRFFDSGVKETFDLLVGMHPDGATDIIIIEAERRKIPFCVVPCCVRPAAVTYWGEHSYPAWVRHLRVTAEGLGFEVCEMVLPICGANVVLKGGLGFAGSSQIGIANRIEHVRELLGGFELSGE